MDDVREGRPSFWNSGAVKSKVRDVIDGDLWVKIQKTQSFKDFGTWHLTQDLNMSRVCTRWVLTPLTIENLKN